MSPRLGHLRVKQVLWDWNGTLLDDVDHCIRVINGLLRDAGLPEVDRVRYHDVFDFPVRGYYERLGFELDASRWERLAARFIADYDRESLGCALHEGAVEALVELGRRGVKSSVLSAARRHSIEELLDHHRVRSHFEDVIGLDDHYAEGKAHLGIEWMRDSGAEKQDVLLIGDTTHDYEVARAMGVPCVLVTTGHHPRRRLEVCDCPVIDSVAELF